MKHLLLSCLVLVCFACVHGKGGGRGGGGRGGRGGGGIFGSIWGKSSSRHTYPASTGFSGYGGSHGYPLSSSGLSGLSKTPGFKYGQRYGSYRFNYVPRVPSYYTVPQYMYVNQYRQSNSRFNNLLIGLTMYNMGRSHVFHNHYYHDSYYRRSSSSASSNADHAVTTTSAEEKDEDKDEATCLLRVTENEKEEMLKIPCAIVTTFTEGTRKVPLSSNSTTTVCVNSSLANSTSLESTENASNFEHKSESMEIDMTKNEIVCKSTLKSVNPLSVTGSPLNTTGIECTIEIWTQQEVISNEVECEVLLKYAKMPVPQNKDAIIMPPRSELKEMLEHPPWWLALFLAV